MTKRRRKQKYLGHDDLDAYRKSSADDRILMRAEAAGEAKYYVGQRTTLSTIAVGLFAGVIACTVASTNVAGAQVSKWLTNSAFVLGLFSIVALGIAFVAVHLEGDWEASVEGYKGVEAEKATRALESKPAGELGSAEPPGEDSAPRTRARPKRALRR